MNREEATALVKQHGSIKKAAKAAKVSRHVIGRSLRKVSTPVQKARSLADFRATYDKSYYLPQKIKKAIATLGQGWDYEVSFAKLAGVSLVDLGLVRDEFADHIVSIGKDNRRVWCGSKAMAAQMRGMV